MKYLVGIDEGTSSCKTCVFDEDGNLLASASREYPSYYPAPGYVEQDLQEIIRGVYDSCREAIRKSGVKREEIAGVSFSNQGALLLLDENGDSALARAIGWQDMRYNEVLPEARERMLKVMSEDEYFDLAGMSYGFYNIPQIDWVRKNDPDGWKRVACCCGHQTFLLKKFGVKDFCIDESEAAVLGMMNVKTREWDDRLIETYGIDRSLLPRIVHKPGDVVGHVTEEVAFETGLPAGCNIGIGGHDVNCSKMGCGAKEGGTETLIVGTAGVSLLVCDDDIKDPNKRITFRTNPGFSNYQQYILTYTAASSFRWFRDELCTFEVAASRLMNSDPYDIMTSIARNSKPGANGVTAMTCLQGSHGRRKNGNARGTFFGISLGTTKADLAQAIMEGITYEMYDIIRMNEEYTHIDKVRLCGGVIKSPYWCQMFADVFGKPIEVTESPELGALGAAMFAGIAGGVFRDCSEAIDRCVRLAKTYTPDAERHKVYAEAFERWCEAYMTVNGTFYKQS